ncbi:MAG: SusC/RagA family TonB-linked outer membrane protein [Lentimicrobiaceae bacterium]|nr:SusC/RagA family TonB-linked outer membrane protein [Lentimicrobiaceae bacterium]
MGKKRSRIVGNWLIMAVMLMLTTALTAQNLSISGSVSDANSGEILIGVTLLQKGTTVGTTTDLDGKYSLSVPAGAVLVVSYVGYVTREITVQKAGKLDIKLAPAVTELEDLIVIGYAVQRKSDKTGAVSSVEAGELQGGVITDPIQGIQGKASGVSVTKKGGDPNEGFSVRIRGASGFSASTQPLFVIDGVPGADPTIIAPEDIESFNILKDAASTAIYGSRGANGVVIITTKKGKSPDPTGKAASYSQVDFSTQVSIDRVARKLDVLDAAGMRDFANTLLKEAQVTNPNATIDSVFIDGGASTDWQDEIYRTAVTTTSNLSLSGGNQRSSYYASVTQANWQGVMHGTSKDRTSARMAFTHTAFENMLRFSGNMIGTFEKNDYENYDGWDKDDIIYQAISRNPTDPVYLSDGETYYQTSRVFNYENPIAIINEVTNNRDAKRYLGNIRADLEPLKGLIFSGNFGYTRNDHTKNYFRPSGLYASADNGFGKKEYENVTEKLMELTGTYTTTIRDFHNVNVLGGYSWQESVKSGFFAQGGDAQSDHAGPDNLQVLNQIKWGDINSWKGKWNLIGFFGRVQYNFNQTYYLSASLRRDGSSKFGKNNKWGTFPTVAAGWNLTNEPFLSDVRWLNQLKLRASYGVAGNQEIGEYRSIVVWEPSGKATNPETGQEVITFKPAWNANPNLKWEETAEVNVGIDFSIFNSQISGSLEVYQKTTTDLLGEYNVPVPPNLASKTFANSGSMENMGIELYVQAFPLKSKVLDWKTSLTVSHNQTKITDLGDYFEEGAVRKEGYVDGRGMVGEENYVTGIMVGEATGAFYLPVYVALKDGKFIYESASGGFTDNLAEAKRVVVANAAPFLEIGWSNSLTFKKRLRMDMTFRSMIGNHVYNATRMFFDNPGNLPSLNALPDAIDWREKGRSSGSGIADLYVENATFLKLDHIALSYLFDMTQNNWVRDLSVFVSANNLFTLTGYTGVDPETKIDGLAFGIDKYNVYPKTRSLTLGVRATF